MRFTASAIRRITLLAALALPSAVLAQSGPFSPEQREAIGGIVREYLVKNPEVLQEAFTELQRRMQETEQAGQAEVLTSERGKLESSPRDFVLGNRRATSPWSNSSTTTVATASGPWPM